MYRFDSGYRKDTFILSFVCDGIRYLIFLLFSMGLESIMLLLCRVIELLKIVRKDCNFNSLYYVPLNNMKAEIFECRISELIQKHAD